MKLRDWLASSSLPTHSNTVESMPLQRSRQQSRPSRSRRGLYGGKKRYKLTMSNTVYGHIKYPKVWFDFFTWWVLFYSKLQPLGFQRVNPASHWRTWQRERWRGWEHDGLNSARRRSCQQRTSWSPRQSSEPAWRNLGIGHTTCQGKLGQLPVPGFPCDLK